MKKLLIILFVFLSGNLLAQKYTRVGDFVFNIVDFGATTASSNNAVQIQKAIDKANANGGGTVYIPRKGNAVWKTGKLVMYSNVRLQGDGYGDTLQSATADTLITYDNASFTFAEGAQFDGLFLNGASTGTVGISAQLLFHFHFSNSKVINFTQYGFYGKGILIGQFDNFGVDNCNNGVYLDSTNFGGVVAPNIIIFRGGEIRNNVGIGVTVKNSQGIGCYFDGVTFEGNGVIHNHATGVFFWTTSTGTGATFMNCWFEANKGILCFLGSTGQTITHTFINCFMSNNPSASYGLDLNAPTNKLHVVLIGTNLQSDSLDIFFDNISITGFFTQPEVDLVGNVSIGTTNDASIAYLLIKDHSADYINNLHSNSGTPTLTLKNGAGAGATGSVAIGSNIGGTITVTTAGTPAANDTVCFFQQGNVGFTTGSHPVLTPANAAAASLAGTAQVWVNGTTNKVYILSNAVALTTGTVYKWNVIMPGL